MSPKQRRTFIKAFIELQFGYSPDVLIFCGRKSNNCLNHFHERVLRVIYNDDRTSLENLQKQSFGGLWHRCFPVKFAKFLRTSFLQNTSGDRLVKIAQCLSIIEVFAHLQFY